MKADEEDIKEAPLTDVKWGDSSKRANERECDDCLLGVWKTVEADERK